MMRELFGDGATVANNKLENLMVIVLKWLTNVIRRKFIHTNYQ